MRTDELYAKISEAVQSSDIPERLNRILQCMAEIAGNLQGVSEEFLRMIAPVCEIVKDAAQLVCEIVSEEIVPKTIPPREPVRSIGGKPQTNGLALRMPYRARAGARHT